MRAAGHAGWDEFPSLDAVGLLEGAEKELWNLHLAGCEVCREEVRGLTEAAVALAYDVTPVKPPAGLRQRLLVSLNAHPSRQIVRAGEGEWAATPFPGVEVRRLSANAATGDLTSLVRMSAGAVYAPHRHGGSEHCYVLEGDLEFEDHTLAAGDYSLSAAGTTHSRATSKGGCVLLIVHNVADELLAMRA